MRIVEDGSIKLPYVMTEPVEPFRRFCWMCHGFKEHRDGGVVLPAQCQKPDACGQ